MSILEQTSPLNLVRKIAIITHASTELGARVCRTFLKHNCLVLGIDTGPIHPSLNSRVGTHMQYLQCGGWQGIAPDVSAKDVLAASVRKFDGREGVNYLVTLGGEGEGWEFVEGIVREMEGRGVGGLVLNVLSEGDGRLKQTVKEAAEKYKAADIRFNIVSSDGKASEDVTKVENIFNHDAYEAVKSLKSAHDSTEEYVRARGIANLLMFLASRDSAGINGMLVGVDGTCAAL